MVGNNNQASCSWRKRRVKSKARGQARAEESDRQRWAEVGGQGAFTKISFCISVTVRLSDFIYVKAFRKSDLAISQNSFFHFSFVLKWMFATGFHWGCPPRPSRVNLIQVVTHSEGRWVILHRIWLALKIYLLLQFLTDLKNK